MNKITSKSKNFTFYILSFFFILSIGCAPKRSLDSSIFIVEGEEYETEDWNYQNSEWSDEESNKAKLQLKIYNGYQLMLTIDTLNDAYAKLGAKKSKSYLKEALKYYHQKHGRFPGLDPRIIDKKAVIEAMENSKVENGERLLTRDFDPIYNTVHFQIITFDQWVRPGLEKIAKTKWFDQFENHLIKMRTKKKVKLFKKLPLTREESEDLADELDIAEDFDAAKVELWVGIEHAFPKNPPVLNADE